MTPPSAGRRPTSPGRRPPPDSIVVVAEIRDYERINAEMVQRLDAGRQKILLKGAEGQRLLLAGLAGPWTAVVEIEGNAGPELAAAVSSPRADGASRREGRRRSGPGPPRGPSDRPRRRGRRARLRSGRGDHHRRRGRRDTAPGWASAAACSSSWGASAGSPAIARRGARLFVLADRLGPYAGRGQRGGRTRPAGAEPPPRARG